MYDTDTTDKYLWISDVDNTVLGDFEGLHQLSLALSHQRIKLIIAFSSGRSIESLKASLVENPLMPTPDFLVGEVGTKIEEIVTGERDHGYITKLENSWDRDKIKELLSHQPWQIQPEEFQSSLKLSYYAKPETEPVESARTVFAEHNIEVTTIYSSKRDLDFLPPGAGKGGAVARLVEMLGMPKERVIVSGDSGNDLLMFKQGCKGIVVGNAHQELKNLQDPNIYHAQGIVANGVLEGLRHFGVIT